MYLIKHPDMVTRCTVQQHLPVVLKSGLFSCKFYISTLIGATQLSYLTINQLLFISSTIIVTVANIIKGTCTCRGFSTLVFLHLFLVLGCLHMHSAFPSTGKINTNWLIADSVVLFLNVIQAADVMYVNFVNDANTRPSRC